MVSKNEIVIIDGVEYTQEELDVLREFTRNPTITEDYRSCIDPLAAFLNMQENSHISINTFLAKGVLPEIINSKESLVDFLRKIELLYTVSCKYGATHDFPQGELYREEHAYNSIPGDHHYADGNAGKRFYVNDSFKSYSKSRAASDTFRGPDGTTKKIVIKGNNKSSKAARNIPFIDVNRLLGTEHKYSEEKEILLSPYQVFSIDPKTSIFPRNPRNWNSPENDFQMYISSTRSNPYTSKNQQLKSTGIKTFNTDSHDVSDAELTVFVELINKGLKNLSKNEFEFYDKIVHKLMESVMHRCSSIYKATIGQPLIVGKNATEEAKKKYPHALAAHSISKNIASQIITKKDLSAHTAFGDLANFKKDVGLSNEDYLLINQYNVVKNSALPFSYSTIEESLNANHHSGNLEIVRDLAQQGLLVSEVLAYDGKIFPKGYEHTAFLTLNLNQKSSLGRSEPLLLSQFEESPFAKNLKNDHYRDTFRLESYGFRPLIEDSVLKRENAKKNLEQASRKKTSQELMTGLTSFEEEIAHEVNFTDKDGLIQIEEEFEEK